jgi:hypothetical protein
LLSDGQSKGLDARYTLELEIISTTAADRFQEIWNEAMFHEILNAAIFISPRVEISGDTGDGGNDLRTGGED